MEWWRKGGEVGIERAGRRVIVVVVAEGGREVAMAGLRNSERVCDEA